VISEAILAGVRSSATTSATPSCQRIAGVVRKTKVELRRSVALVGGLAVPASCKTLRLGLPLSPSSSDILSDTVHVRVCSVEQFVSGDRG
jgi:hypothetical protein